jgi:hypothetical protein
LVFFYQGFRQFLLEVVYASQNFLDILSDQSLAQGASQGIDGKNLAELPGEVTILGSRVEFKLGALQLSMMPAYIPIEVVDSSDPDGLFQEVATKTEQAQATITFAGDIPHNDFQGPLLAAFHPKI